MRVLRNIRNRYPDAWCTYGFVNAFNPLKNWYDSDVVAIDTGITLLMAENARTQFHLGHVHEESEKQFRACNAQDSRPTSRSILPPSDKNESRAAVGRQSGS